MSEQERTLEDVRTRLAAALGIRIEDLASRVGNGQPLANKLFVAAYALDNASILPRAGIAELMGRPQSWINFAIESVSKRIVAHDAYRQWVEKVTAAIKPAGLQTSVKPSRKLAKHAASVGAADPVE